MADVILCGDAGGRTAAGKPCRRRAVDGGLCAIHAGTANVGRPPAVLTDEQVEQVEKLAAVLTQEQIADFLGIDDDTLRKQIREDSRISRAYARGRAKAIAGMGRSVFRAGLEGDTQAARFYLASHAGWGEKQRHEHSGPDGGAIPHAVTVRFVRPEDTRPEQEADADG